MANGLKGRGIVTVNDVDKKRSELTEEDVMALWEEEEDYLKEVQYTYEQIAATYLRNPSFLD